MCSILLFEGYSSLLSGGGRRISLQIFASTYPCSEFGVQTAQQRISKLTGRPVEVKVKEEEAAGAAAAGSKIAEYLAGTLLRCGCLCILYVVVLMEECFKVNSASLCSHFRAERLLFSSPAISAALLD